MAKKVSKPKPVLRRDLYRGNCALELYQCVKNGTADLIVADPPYNIGQQYEDYYDQKTVQEYLDWTQLWVQACKEALRSTGSMFVFINDALVSEVDVLIKSLGFHPRSKIVWYYTFGQNTQGNFTPSHTNILYYSKHKTKRTWNGDDPQCRIPSARQLVYKDKRANPAGRLPDNTWILYPHLLPEGSFNPLGDTWLESRVAGTFNARRAHSPNQLPQPLVDRIVLLTSSAGDLVVDPFVGTGTTGLSCVDHNRNFVGIDVSKSCLKQAKERIDTRYAELYGR